MSVPWRGKLRPGARAPATGQVRETGQDRPLPATPATSLRMGGHLPGTVRTRGGRQAGTEVTGGKLPGRCHTTRSPVSIRTTSAPVPHITSSRKSPTQAGPPLPQPPWPAWSPRLWVLPSPPTMSPRARGRARRGCLQDSGRSAQAPCSPAPGRPAVQARGLRLRTERRSPVDISWVLRQHGGTCCSSRPGPSAAGPGGGPGVAPWPPPSISGQPGWRRPEPGSRGHLRPLWRQVCPSA